MNKSAVEIGKTQEQLNILDFPRFGPILDDFDLIIVHSESAWGQDIAKILHCVLVKGAFVGAGI